jgi:hypothetical protein
MSKEPVEPLELPRRQPPGLDPFASPFGAPSSAPLRSEPVGTLPRGLRLGETPATGRTLLSNPHPESRVEPASDLAAAATLTETSSAGKGDPRITAKIVVGVVGLLFGLAGWGLYRAGRDLRKPSKEQVADFATPIGAIIARRTDLSWLGEDINDLTIAAAVVTDWASDGPIAPLRPGPDVQQVGMETDDTTGAPVGPAAPTFVPDPNVTYLP